VKPWADGGADTVENLRLRCRAHNQQAARHHFGDEYVRNAVLRGRRCYAVDRSRATGG
jgi:hypothetical protein